jgi:probable rRNA maturation factor
MFTHGMLHILGFDHENDKEAVNMESKEIEFLSKFNIINPYIL